MDSGTLLSLTTSSLTDDDLCEWRPRMCAYPPKAFPHSSFPVAPKQTKRVKSAPRLKPPLSNTSFHPLHQQTWEALSETCSLPHTVFCLTEQRADHLGSSGPREPVWAVARAPSADTGEARPAVQER